MKRGEVQRRGHFGGQLGFDHVPVNRILVIARETSRAAQQIAFEIMLLAGDHPGLIELQKHEATQIARRGLGMLFTVNGPPDQDLFSKEFRAGIVCIASLDERADRPVQGIVFRSKDIAATVPGEHRLAGGVVQHPAVAGVHAVLEEQVAGDVVAGQRTRATGSSGLVVRHGRRDVLHHQVAARIANPQRLAFGVELGEGEVFFVALARRHGVSHPVVRDGDDLAAEAVEHGERRACWRAFDQPGGTRVFCVR